MVAAGDAVVPELQTGFRSLLKGKVTVFTSSGLFFFISKHRLSLPFIGKSFENFLYFKLFAFLT